MKRHVLKATLFPCHSYSVVDIFIDFIEALPKFEGIETILVIVDWLTKHVHFAHPLQNAMLPTYMDYLHGLPQIIIYN